MTIVQARAAYLAARNRYDGTWASQQRLEAAALRLAEAEIRAMGAPPPERAELRRYW